MTNNKTEIIEVTGENDTNNPAKFYEDAQKYWSQIPATVDGMLGGFGFISDIDIKGSRHFLNFLFQLNNNPSKHLALDCGAGIGRITKNLLAPIFNQVDMVEQNPLFVKDSLQYIGKLRHKVRQQFATGLQDFTPAKEEYDVIWCQWVLGHLKDEDLVDFLIRCKEGIKPNGIIVVKENVTSSDLVEMDEQDSSVTRPHRLLRSIFKKADLDCLRDTRQTNFPKGLYGVHMFALRRRKIGLSKEVEIRKEIEKLSVVGDNESDQDAPE